MGNDSVKIISYNRKARFDYEILEKIEAGLVLAGTEVKSLRNGQANLKEAYAVFRNHEVFLIGMHIPPYEHGNRFNPDPDRERKLLLHKREILRLQLKIKQDGLALVPLCLYFQGKRVKVELGLGRGKKLYDKRESMKKRSAERDMRASGN